MLRKREIKRYVEKERVEELCWERERWRDMLRKREMLNDRWIEEKNDIDIFVIYIEKELQKERKTKSEPERDKNGEREYIYRERKERYR